MQRPTRDWGGNVIAYVVVVVANVLSNALPINNQTMPEISARYPSLFTPAGFTFSIWGVIYAALLVFVVWQALPSQRDNAKVAALSNYFKLNCLMNALWIVVWHYNLLALSLVVMLVILVTLIRIYRELLADIDMATWGEHAVLYLPFRVYTAWIAIATIANASVVQTGFGWDDIGISAVQWTLLKLAFAGAIGATMVIKLRDIPFALVVAWATYGISMKQAATPAVAGTALTLSILMLILVAKDGVDRLIRQQSY